jgi:hypothetical protein
MLVGAVTHRKVCSIVGRLVDTLQLTSLVSDELLSSPMTDLVVKFVHVTIAFFVSPQLGVYSNHLRSYLIIGE